MIVHCSCQHPVHLADPRKQDTCGRCGRSLRDGEVVPFAAKPHVRPRDHAFERDMAHAAGHHAGLPGPARDLREFADKRMHPGPWRLGREFTVEGLEELPDALSYFTERAREIAGREDDAGREASLLLVEVCADLVAAFWKAQRVRDLVG